MQVIKYPSALRPDGYETHIVNDQEVRIPIVHLKFKKWQGEPIANTFGGKGLIDYQGQPIFAELAIMQTAIAGGWQARWVETYAMKANRPYYFSSWTNSPLPTQVQDPILDPIPLASLESIYSNNGESFYGCWDVIMWHGKNVIYVEAKRLKKDKVRITQDRWLEAGLNAGFDSSRFMIAWWDFN